MPKESKSDGDKRNSFGTGEHVMMDLKKRIAEGNKKKVEIVVSYPFHNKEKDTYLYGAIPSKANKTFFSGQSIIIKLSKYIMRDR